MIFSTVLQDNDEHVWPKQPYQPEFVAISYRVEKSHNATLSMSFISFSLGGLIVRASLDKINKKDNLFTYISLSSPHLGLSSSLSIILKVFGNSFSHC